ncbi:MAG: Tat pathway signal protein [Alphaproteobacteria bacterium]|nr:Tat pathway signal protein [Alphaproteobacteria bacterium]
MAPSRPALIVCLAVAAALAASAPCRASDHGSGGGHGSPQGSGTASRKPTFSDSYLVIEPFVVSVIQNGRVQGSLLIELGLDVKDGALRDKADHLMPRLRDAYVTALSRFAATRIEVGVAPNVEALSRLLQMRTDEALGAPGAQVLLAQVVLHR